jgi:hypothetical protein
MAVTLLGSAPEKPVTRRQASATQPHALIACPVCSHLAHSERTDGGLRITCGHCAAVYAVDAKS